jgi:hypothetical protein
MAALSEWLQIMLAEIARKREEQERACEEDKKRESESASETNLSQLATPARVPER